MNTNDFALEQLETRLEMYCGWHLHFAKVCLVRLPWIGCVAYIYRPYWSWHC